MEVFISQPMSGLSDADILAKRDAILEKAAAHFGEEVREVPSFVHRMTKEHKNHPLYCLGKSLTLLACADLCIFAEGWKDARGCRMEHAACEEYGVPHMDEKYL